MSNRSMTQIAYAVVGGCCLGFLLFYLGLNAPSIFTIEENFNYGETIGMLIVTGITFGFYLARSFDENSSVFSVFTASFLATIIFVPILLFSTSFVETNANSQVTDWNILIALILPFLVSFSLIQGKLLSSFTKAKNSFYYFCSKISWYLFEVHLIYVYELPLLDTFLSQIQSRNLDASTALNLGILTTFLVVFFSIIHFIIQVRQD